MKYYVAISLFFATLGLVSCRRSYHAWNSTGPIQVVGNDKEIWLFMESDRQVRHPSSFLGCDTPKVYPVGHSQVVIAIHSAGILERNPLRSTDSNCGVTFHPRISKIFRKDGKTWLFKGTSMYRKPSLYSWNHERFELLSEQKSLQFANSVTHPSDEFFDAVTENDGWNRYYSASGFGDDEFMWDDKSVRIKFLGESNMEFHVSLEVAKEGTVLIAQKLSFKKNQQVLTEDEYRKLPQEDPGYQK